MGRSPVVNPEGTLGRQSTKMRICGFHRLKTALALYEQVTEQNHSQPSDQRLNTFCGTNSWTRKSEPEDFEARRKDRDRDTGEKQKQGEIS